jgi:hypothetical protein
MPRAFTESTVESAALAWLDGAGPRPCGFPSADS